METKTMIECKECCREITKEESEEYDGLCKKCYELSQENAVANDEVSENYETKKHNKTAILIKIIAIIGVIAGVCIGFSQLGEYEEEAGITYIVVSIISGIFIYALGEIIQLLEDIKNK